VTGKRTAQNAKKYFQTSIRSIKKIPGKTEENRTGHSRPLSGTQGYKKTELLCSRDIETKGTNSNPA